MTAENVRKKVNSLRKKFAEKDPERLALKMGIKLFYEDNFKALRGMYAVILKTRCIFVNSNLSDEEKRFIISHEIGHDVLHREFAKKGALQDRMIIDMKLKPEYEANLFAAELLIEDEDIESLSKDGYDIFEAGKILGIDPNLVSLKLRILKEIGKDFNETEYDADFIK